MTVTTFVPSQIDQRPRVDLEQRGWTEHIEQLKILEDLKAQVQRDIDEIRDALRKEIGVGAVGWFRGAPLFAHTLENRIAYARLAKEQPEVYQHFLREVVTQELDLEKLRRERPDLVDQYAVTSLKPVGSRS